MNDEQKDMYLAWLNDAHAMEMGLITMLEKQVKETENDSMMQERIRQHLEETKDHAEMVEGCIERNGGKVSTSKDLMSKMSAALNGFGMSMASDAMVKNVLNSYAAENLEIASYTAIKAAAEELGDVQTSAVCDKILEDEESMAEWLLEQLPTVVQRRIVTMEEM